MKKKTLMSIVLLAIIGTSAVFAQAPTLDKIFFVDYKVSNDRDSYDARASNDKTKRNGVIVIPDTYNGKPVVAVGNFSSAPDITGFILPNSLIVIRSSAFANDTGLTSITIPASVTTIVGNAFGGCTNLTSVTFQGSGIALDNKVFRVFPGDLDTKYKAGGAGTYTRPAGGEVWTKQGGFSLSGVWTRADGMKITIADNGANIVITGDKPDNGGKLSDTYNKR